MKKLTTLTEGPQFIVSSVASLLIGLSHILMTIQIYVMKNKMSLFCGLSTLSSSCKLTEHRHLPLTVLHYKGERVTLFPLCSHLCVTSDTEMFCMCLCTQW